PGSQAGVASSSSTRSPTHCAAPASYQERRFAAAEAPSPRRYRILRRRAAIVGSFGHGAGGPMAPPTPLTPSMLATASRCSGGLSVGPRGVAAAYPFRIRRRRLPRATAPSGRLPHSAPIGILLYGAGGGVAARAHECAGRTRRVVGGVQ